MTTSHALAIAIDGQFTIHSATQLAAEKLRKLALAAFPIVPRTCTAQDYYRRASTQVCYSAPVTSLGRIA